MKVSIGDLKTSVLRKLRSFVPRQAPSNSMRGRLTTLRGLTLVFERRKKEPFPVMMKATAAEAFSEASTKMCKTMGPPK